MPYLRNCSYSTSSIIFGNFETLAIRVESNLVENPEEPYVCVKIVPIMYRVAVEFGRKLEPKIALGLNEPRCEKTGLRGFRPGPTQTGLYSHRRWLEA